MKQDHSSIARQHNAGKRRIWIAYIFFLHVAIVALIGLMLIVTDGHRKLDSVQKKNVAEAAGFRKCIEENNKSSDCSTLHIWYVNNYYSPRGGKTIDGDTYGVETKAGFLAYVVVDPYGKILLVE